MGFGLPIDPEDFPIPEDAPDHIKELMTKIKEEAARSKMSEEDWDNYELEMFIEDLTLTQLHFVGKLFAKIARDDNDIRAFVVFYIGLINGISEMRERKGETCDRCDHIIKENFHEAT